MILRLLNFIVIAMLVFSAACVYRIKFDSTLQAERLAKLRSEVRHERDKLASLRAQWGELANPARIQTLAQRFLKLKPIAATQLDSLDHLPARPPDHLPPGAADPIGAMIAHLEESSALTGSVPSPTVRSPHSGEETAAPALSASSVPPPTNRPELIGAPGR